MTINFHSLVNVFLIFTAALSMMGCSNTVPQRTVFSESSVVYFPEVGTQGVAEVGQGILSKAKLRKLPGINLSKTVSEVVAAPGLTTIKAGDISLSTTTEEGKFYVDTNGSYTMLGAEVPTIDRAGIFVPNAKNLPAVIFHYRTTYNFGKIPVSGIQPTTIESWDIDSFKRELIYLGVQQNTINIQYREFKDQIARPAFSQEIKYDLSQGKEIGYKGARFEIIKATNTELVYKVLKPLD